MIGEGVEDPLFYFVIYFQFFQKAPGTDEEGRNDDMGSIVQGNLEVVDAIGKHLAVVDHTGGDGAYAKVKFTSLVPILIGDQLMLEVKFDSLLPFPLKVMVEVVDSREVEGRKNAVEPKNNQDHLAVAPKKDVEKPNGHKTQEGKGHELKGKDQFAALMASDVVIPYVGFNDGEPAAGIPAEII